MKQLVVVLLAVGFGFGSVFAQSVDPPDAKINPVSLEIEIADPVWSETNFDIRYVVNPGRNATTFDLAVHPADDLRPRLAIGPNGDAWVVWWRDLATPQILLRTHDYASDTWSVEAVAGLPGRNPDIAFDGTRAWIAYEATDSAGTVVTLDALDDTPDPVSLTSSVATTTYQGQMDLQLHVKAGRLWVTWIDSDSEIGWSLYDAATEFWGLPGYENYASQGSKQALSQIESVVLAQ